MAEPLKFPHDSARNDYCVEVMARLNIQRSHINMCDVTLMVEGTEFMAHRSVLSAASPYFEKMFACDMKEKTQESVCLEELPVSAMECLLDYLYTGDVQVTETNAQDLITSANYLLLPGLKTQAGRFLQQNLDVSNCIVNYYFAAKYQCDDLLQNVRGFVNSNFIPVSESEDFLALTYDQVKEWISSDDIIIGAEEDAFNIVLQWIANDASGNRESYFLELFRCIRLTLVSRDYLFNDVIDNQLVRENRKCMDLALNAMKQIAHASSESLRRENPRKCLEMHVDALVICGGRSTLCYLPSDARWYELACMLSNRSFHGVGSCQGCLYAVGGTMNEIGFPLAELYNPRINSWSPIQAPAQDARLVAVAALKGFLYLVGGMNPNSERLDTVCRYDPDTNSWRQVASLSSPRSSVCAVADDKYIYAIGGRTDEAYLNIVEKFEPRANAWTSVASMRERRACACGAVLGGNIFVFGGTWDVLGNTASRTCEMYSCTAKQWQAISSMHVPRYHASAVAFEKYIYVFGGFGTNGLREKTLELYDPKNNEWNDMGTMPIDSRPGGTYRACALRLCKTVLQSLAPLN